MENTNSNTTISFEIQSQEIDVEFPVPPPLAPILAYVGPKGDKGDTGLQGPIGPGGGATGPQGPPGVPAPVDSYIFTHQQDAPSNTWNIDHELGKFPSVTIVDSAGSTIVGEVSYVDSNHITISFSIAINGTAYLN